MISPLMVFLYALSIAAGFSVVAMSFAVPEFARWLYSWARGQQTSLSLIKRELEALNTEMVSCRQRLRDLESTKTTNINKLGRL